MDSFGDAAVEFGGIHKGGTLSEIHDGLEGMFDGEWKVVEEADWDDKWFWKWFLLFVTGYCSLVATWTYLVFYCLVLTEFYQGYLLVPGVEGLGSASYDVYFVVV